MTEYEKLIIARARAMASSENMQRIAGTLGDLASALESRANSAAPEQGDVAKLRAAAQEAVDYLEGTVICAPVERAIAKTLRAALAAAPEPPIEGPVREGDTVSVQPGTATEIAGEYAWVHFSWADELVPLTALTIVARPAAPAETPRTCGECRWLRTDPDPLCLMYRQFRTLDSLPCKCFELYPPKGAA